MKKPRIDTEWTPGGRPCIGDHPCPSTLYPNHHDVSCACVIAPLDIQEIDRCDMCGAIVCVGCKGTIF